MLEPFFVYGSLQPTQPGFRQLARLVEHHEPVAVVDHAIFIRDGLPGLVAYPGGRVHGFLLHPRAGCDSELADAIDAFESKDLYTRKQSIATETGIRAWTVLMKSPGKGNKVLWEQDQWTLADDPMLVVGMPVIRDNLAQILSASSENKVLDPVGFWREYIPLMGNFLSLTAVLERLVTFRFGGRDVMERIRQFDLSEDGRSAALRAGYMPPQVLSTRDLEPSHDSKPWQGWYQVRNNAVHRGKAAIRDRSVVASAAVGLHDALAWYLKDEIPGVWDAWGAPAEAKDWLLAWTMSQHDPVKE